jgi:hypothetical protein
MSVRAEELVTKEISYHAREQPKILMPVQFFAQSVAFCNVVALLALHGGQHSDGPLERS